MYSALKSSYPFSLNAPKAPTNVSPAPTVLTVLRSDEAKCMGGIIILFPSVQITHPRSPRVTTTTTLLPLTELDILVHAGTPLSIDVRDLASCWFRIR